MNSRPLSLFLFFCLTGLVSSSLLASGKTVPVGEYLYADLKDLPENPGQLQITGTERLSPSALILAWARGTRKTVLSRENTTEKERAQWKIRKAVRQDDGSYLFEKLHPDFYDLILLDPDKLCYWENLVLTEDEEEFQQEEPEKDQALQEEIKNTLSGTWEGFFDTKKIERLVFLRNEREEISGAVVLLQQMRAGHAVAESGASLSGIVHSLDVVWLEAPLKGNRWRVLQRQQLFRGEIKDSKFLRHFSLDIPSCRIGRKVRRISLQNSLPFP